MLKSAGVVAHTCNPSAGGTKGKWISGVWDLLDSQVIKYKANKNPVSKCFKMDSILMNDSQYYPLASTCMCTYGYMKKNLLQCFLRRTEVSKMPSYLWVHYDLRFVPFMSVQLFFSEIYSWEVNGGIPCKWAMCFTNDPQCSVEWIINGLSFNLVHTWTHRHMSGWNV